jgi:hypothetical protein
LTRKLSVQVFSKAVIDTSGLSSRSENAIELLITALQKS